MTAEFAFNLVTAIDDTKAVSETAALFAELRPTMR
jgi:hypothetical protein